MKNVLSWLPYIVGVFTLPKLPHMLGVFTLSWLPYILGVLALLGSVAIGYWVLDYLFSRGIYNTKNAHDLLKLEKAEEWNSFRTLNPSWQPKLKLKDRDFSNLSLPEVNFQRVVLDGAKFREGLLDGADFTESSLRNADFSGASLKGAIFDRAQISGANFKGALLENVSTIETDIEDVDFPITKTKQKEKPVRSLQDLATNLNPDPSILANLTPRDFEELVAKVMEGLGYEVQLVGGAGMKDTGIDIMASRHDPVATNVYAIECKYYNSGRLVGASPVRTLYAAKQINNATRAILVTNSRFTEEARAVASRFDEIQLVDGDQLLEWIKKTNIIFNR
jgi:HJR/Mrr/RecB family endonuclease